MILPFRDKSPIIPESCFVAPNATVVGSVTLNDQASIWFGAVVRGDGGPILIGRGSNVQDNAVVHCRRGDATLIGNNVSIGHGAVVHGCTIENDVLIGIGAIILDGAVIKSRTVIGAGALVPPREKVGPNVLYLGQPPNVTLLYPQPRHFSPVNVVEAFDMIDITAERYVEYIKLYAPQT